MTKAFLIAIAVLAFLLLVTTLLFLYEKSKAKSSKELYEETKRRNIELSETLGKLRAAEIIRSEERKKADEKIAGVNSCGGVDRFNAINAGLSDGAS